MIFIGGENKSGCWPSLLLFAAFLVMMGTKQIGFLCVFLPILLFFIIRMAHLSTLRKSASDEEFFREYARRSKHGQIINQAPPIVTQPMDETIGKIRSLHASVIRLLDDHMNHPMVQATGDDIRKEADELVQEAAELVTTRDKIRSLVSSKPMLLREVHDLKAEIASETNPKVKAVLESTLERLQAALDNHERLESSVRYFEALLDQAEATMVEIKSRIGVALAETDDYTNPRARLALSEASNELRSVSNAMRETLNELDTSG